MTHVERLIALCHHRWSVPMLAELDRRAGARFVEIVHRLDVSPTAVRMTLDHLIDVGWVRPNPGYGHPLRPEYILTRVGERIAPLCRQVDDALIELDARAVGLKKWSLPSLDAIGESGRRFGEIAERLVGSTDRAIALALSDLSRVALVDRPPGSQRVYRTTAAGLVLLPALSAV